MKLEHILAELAECQDENAIQAFHTTYLGKKGSISGLFKTLADLTPEEKKTKGQEFKQLFEEVEKAFYNKQREIQKAKWDVELTKEIIDYSTPVSPLPQGHMHPLAEMRRKVEQIFQGMGFNIEYGDHLVSQYHNFTSLNIPPTHPATEMHDTLYVQQTDNDNNKLLMRTHTTVMDNQLIQKHGTPCKFVIPGKVYRHENLDASHDCVFWQVDGVVIDKHISIGHFKFMMRNILEALLEKEVQMRLRPAYFPFVEPGFEIDARHQVGKHEKRLEILGAGMIHPYVLKEAGVDPNEYSGFAFGMGMTRLVAIKNNISDVRVLTNGDVRFVRSI